MKTVVVNAMSALQGGGQTYLINLFKYFESSKDVRVFVIVPKEYENLFNSSVNKLEIKILAPKFPAISILHRFLWEILMLPNLLRDLKADVLYCPGGTISISNISNYKIAVAFQNMLPFSLTERKRYPFGYMRFRLWLLRFLQLRSFKMADLVIFISNYAKDITDKTVPLRKGKSVVINHGIEEQYYRNERKRNSPLPYEYILYVSYVDIYKNQLEVIEAWRYLKEMRSTPEKLVLAGPASASYLRKVEERISNYGFKNDVIYLGNIKYNDLSSYYQSAKINIFASTCENCPNILLEAMASGRPLFCSNHMPMPEFAGDAAVYFNPYNPRELADLLGLYIDDDKWLSTIGEKAYERSLVFDSGLSARKTWNALFELID